MSFGSRLLNIRKEQKISQSELAEKIGIHANVLGRYEREEASLSIDTVVKLADALGVSIDYIAGRTDVLLDQVMIDKLVTIHKLPEEDKKSIMYAIDGLIQHAKTRQAYK